MTKAGCGWQGRAQCLDAKEVGLGKPAEETFQALRKTVRERNQRSPLT